MRTLVLPLLLLAVTATPTPAYAVDDYVNLKLQPGLDAGTTATAYLPDSGVSAGSQFMLRCDTYAVRYRLCQADQTCTATADDSPIDNDQDVDICGVNARPWLSVFRPYDGGVGACRVYRVNPQSTECAR